MFGAGGRGSGGGGSGGGALSTSLFRHTSPPDSDMDLLVEQYSIPTVQEFDLCGSLIP